MKLITKLIAIVMLAYSLTINAAAPFFPMEAYSCNYNEGKDLQDYLDVSEDWILNLQLCL